MEKRILVDTNLWLYLLEIDPDHEKQEVVAEALDRLISKGWDIFVCSQVCKEVVRTGTEKYGFDRQLVEEKMKMLKSLANMLYEDCEDVAISLVLRERYNLQFWDSVIIATALNNKIPYILTEDVPYKRIILGEEKVVELINPFEEEQFT